MNQIGFTCTALRGSNKAGILRQDDNGYYTCVVGALDMFNSAGQFYEYNQARELFESSSTLMRRVQRGALRGELGHPRREQGQSLESFAHRVMSIHEDKVCCHHKELWLDFESVKGDNGKPVIAIMSKVMPSGPFGDVLRRSLENPNENVSFSIRAFTDDKMWMGILRRTLKTVVTFDAVNEPGMSVAVKWNSPALEGITDNVTFNRGQLERAVKDSATVGMAQESFSMTADELFASMNWHASQEDLGRFRQAPKWLGWK